MDLKQKIKPFLTILIKFFGVFPIRNKILFSAFSARMYGDNPKYIAEEVKRQGLAADCVFVLENPDIENVPDGIRVVKYNSLRYLYELATAKVWVDNTRKQDFVVKRQGQVYIQTWHGSVPFKKVEKDVESTLDAKYINTAKRDSAMINYLLVNCKLAKDVYENAFWHPREIVITGSPRLDQLISNSNELKKNAIENLKLSNQVKYILYAPTFRDSGDTNVYDVDFETIIRIAHQAFGGEWRVILKLHPNIKNTTLKVSSQIVNASEYSDITELYALCSMIITDYSSTMFDFGITGKPVFLYTPDAVEYLKTRPTYLSMSELPFLTANTFDELKMNIMEFNADKYAYDIQAFYKNLSVLEDGNASKRVVRILKKYIY